jgi:hypothetical protein
VLSEAGFPVTLKWRRWRRWCAKTTKPYSTRKLTVGTTKKSVETSCFTWLLRKARQVCWRDIPRLQTGPFMVGRLAELRRAVSIYWIETACCNLPSYISIRTESAAWWFEPQALAMPARDELASTARWCSPSPSADSSPSNLKSCASAQRIAQYASSRQHAVN